ncbi:MAG: iron-sulfur cluster assembly scaffold protein [Rubrobacter sp.]
MDRRARISFLTEHAKNPRHKGVLEDADVAMPGGSPECGGSVIIYLKGDGNGRIGDLSWTGQGDTISMGATSIVVELVRSEGLGPQEILALDYEAFMDSVGRDVIGSRTRNATLGLSTLKAALRRYEREHPAREAAPESA